LKKILSKDNALAKVFTRHTYGMLSWVDLFGSKLKYITNLNMKLTTARIIADNARHAMLFSDRAKEMGETPETYKPPDIGQKIYDILETFDNPFDDYAYAWGSLIHFSELLDLYMSVADTKSMQILKEVSSDVKFHLSLLEQYFENETDSEKKKKRVEEIRGIADKIYADREDEERRWYDL